MPGRCPPGSRIGSSGSGRAPPSASSLNVDGVVGAAVAARVDAVHPGYGFLSENARLARACAAAGVVFIGPTPETLEAAGDKLAAREHAMAAGLPVLPGGRVDPGGDEPVLPGDRIGPVGHGPALSGPVGHEAVWAGDSEAARTIATTTKGVPGADGPDGVSRVGGAATL